MTNVISDKLKLTTVLQATLEEFRNIILPLRTFSTNIGSDLELNGDGTVTIPYYPIETTASGSRAAKEKYSDKISGTDTQSVQLKPDRNKIQGISFTPEEIRNQPSFDPVRHGRRKGQKLAYDIIEDIFSPIRRANFTGTTLEAVDPANWDEAEVRALRKICNVDKWPAMGRSCWLDSELYSETLGDTAVRDLSQSGSTGALNEGRLPRMYGFDMGEALGMHSNDGAVRSVTAANATNTFTLAADNVDSHGVAELVDGDIVQISGTTAPTGVTADQDYYVINVSGEDFQISATAGGSAVTFSDDGTAVTVQRFERLGGFVAYESGLIVGFAPVEPTPGIRQKLVDYDQITDPESGLVLEYKHIADEDSSQEFQLVECHYGYAVGQAEALKRIEKIEES